MLALYELMLQDIGLQLPSMVEMREDAGLAGLGSRKGILRVDAGRSAQEESDRPKRAKTRKAVHTDMCSPKQKKVQLLSII